MSSKTGILINQRVAAGLKAGAVVYDGRGSGKTTTLLAYVAMFHKDAIIVGPNVAFLDHLKQTWANLFSAPHLKAPRFMSRQQFERADGISGTVFSDELGYDMETDPKLRYRFGGPLQFGGGVKS